MTHYLALDVGTSFIKAGVLNLDTQQISHVRREPFPAPLPNLPAMRNEFDPLQVGAVARRVLEAAATDCPTASGVLMCGQMHGLVLCNARGEAHSNLITWLDQRVLEPHPEGGTHYDALLRRAGHWREDTGRELRPGLPVGNLYWLNEHGLLEPGLFAASLPDFLVAHWCGCAPRTELSNAHAHGCVHLATGNWHEPMIGALGLAALQWPRIVPTGAITGEIDIGGHLLPIHTPVGDYQAALAGALLQHDELSLNVSTGSQISRLMTSFVPGEYQTRPFFGGRYLATVTTIPAGRALNALVTLLGELGRAHGKAVEDPWPYINAQAAAVARAALTVNLSFFNSAVGSEGGIVHMREEHMTVGQLFAAAFDDMAGNYAALAKRVDPAGTCRRLVFSGGLAQKLPPLRERIVARFGLPWRLAPSDEDALFGLLQLGREFAKPGFGI